MENAVTDETRARIFWAVVIGIGLLIGGEVFGYYLEPDGDFKGIGLLLAGGFEFFYLIVPWLKTWNWKKVIGWTFAFLLYWGVAEWVKALYGLGWYRGMWGILIFIIVLLVGRKLLLWWINRPLKPRDSDN